MAHDPPSDSKDASPQRRFRSSEGDAKSAGRRVGAVIDPSVDDDGLGLTGPGSPSSFSGSGDHPVRARLLERARQARSDEPESSAPAPRHVSAPPADWIGAHDAKLKSQLDEAGSDAGSSEGAPVNPNEGASSESSIASADVPSEVDPPVDVPPAYSKPIEYDPPDSAVETAPEPPAPTPTPVPEAIPNSKPPKAGLTPPPAAVANELERIARRPDRGVSGPRLSPNLTALLGGLLGLTVIGSLGLYLSKAETSSGATARVETPDNSPAPKKKKKPKAKKLTRKKIEGPWRVTDDATKPGHRLLKGKIGKKAFLTAIQDAGLPKSEAYVAYNALKSERNLDRCRSSDRFRALVKGGDKSLVGFEYIVNAEEVYQAKKDEKGSFVGKKLDLKVERNQIRLSFTHDGNSFEQSARRAGFDKGISRIAEEALRGHSSMSDFKRGDRLRVLAQEVTVLGEFSRYAGIEAIEIQRAGTETRRIYYYPHPVEGGHFDRNAKAPYEGGWRKPIPDAPRTSPFNPKRMHPVLKRIRPHTGTDFGCATGTPIGATSPGTIVFRGSGGGYGNLIRIKHDGGYESGYAHLSRFEKNLTTGDRVERMQIIGYCGSTGRSTGPHLHFEMKKDGVFIDAESLNLDGLRVLPKSHREEFAEIRAKYDPILDKIPLAEPLESPVAKPTPSKEDASEQPSDNPMMAETALEAEKKKAPKKKATAPRPAPAPSPAGEAAKKVSPSSIFLSDAELLRMQSASDDGEVTD